VEAILEAMTPSDRRQQEYALKLLFVCSRNRRRSLTAEKIFAGAPGLDVRSAGTQPEARIVVTEGLIGWADVIFAMEKSHIARMRLKFAGAMDGKRVIALHIPDDYEFMQAELVDELEAKVAEHLELPE
jgi:predicted protein tyrosine phosphatase